MHKKIKLLTYLGAGLIVILIVLSLLQLSCNMDSFCIWSIFDELVPREIENAIVNQLNKDDLLIIHPNKLVIEKGEQNTIWIGIFNKDGEFHDYNMRVLFIGQENKIDINEWFKPRTGKHKSWDRYKEIIPLNVVIPKNADSEDHRFKIKLLKDQELYAEKEFNISISG